MNSPKRFFQKKTLMLVILLFFIISAAPALDVSLKLSGGISLMALDNINRVLGEWDRYYQTEADQKPSITYLEGEVLDLNSAVDLEAEIAFRISPWLTLSLGSGLLHAAISQDRTTIILDRPAGTTSYSHPVQISVIPAVFSAYYTVKISERIKAYVKGGGGIAWMTYVERSGKKNISKNQKWQWQNSSRSTSQTPYLAGGLGLFYQIEPGIDLFLEGLVRQAKFKDLTGTNIDDENGTLYHLEQYSQDLDFWLEKLQTYTEAPSGEDYRSVRKAIMDFSGFSIKLGVLIRF